MNARTGVLSVCEVSKNFKDSFIINPIDKKENASIIAGDELLNMGI